MKAEDLTVQTFRTSDPRGSHYYVTITHKPTGHTATGQVYRPGQKCGDTEAIWDAYRQECFRQAKEKLSGLIKDDDG